MNFSMSYKNVEAHEPVEKECAPHLKKMEKLLKTYQPDLVQIHGAFELLPRKSEYSVSLNLTLPTGTLHCIGSGTDIRQSLKAAFAELEGQVKKHKSRVRHDYEWKRKRPRAPLPA
jgi:ribosome-associated translation inhibitor RaiA